MPYAYCKNITLSHGFVVVGMHVFGVVVSTLILLSKNVITY